MTFGVDWEAPDKIGKHVTGLHVSNSMTNGRKVEFIPAHGRTVTWYICGPTVYDHSHMGHARTYLSFDMIRRIMEDYFGYEMRIVMNITDIEDKIILRANEKNIPFQEFSRKWENAYWEDMEKLNIKLPHIITRVSEYVEEIIEFVKTIIGNGYAYNSNGSVYFDVAAFRLKHSYAKMEPQSASDESRALEGEGALGVVTEKKSPGDFVLWKKAKEGEPLWDSPWGPGRPGWHIECSAMACKHFGKHLDVHSGGCDLRFPHHDNEIAQCEAHYDHDDWVKYFFHSGHLNIYGEKMSKSLKNFVTVKEVLSAFHPRVLRILVLLNRWDQPMNYAPDGSTMIEAEETDKKFSNFFATVRSKLRSISLKGPQKLSEEHVLMESKLHEAKNHIHTCFLDNFDTPAVLLSIRHLLSDTHKCLMTHDFPLPLLRHIASFVFKILKILGLTNGTEDQMDYEEGSSQKEEEIYGVMNTLVEFRKGVRKLGKTLISEGIQEHGKSLMGLSDEVRDSGLLENGILLKDGAGEDEVVWEVQTKEHLKRLKEAEEKQKLEKETLKLARQQEAQKQLERKNQLKKIPPKNYIREIQGDQFEEYDEEGIPTKKVGGELVSKSQKAKLQKLVQNHTKVYEEWKNSS
eukprot:GHVP01000927.1.p1 GENE.GHVP01000927.1~~GHVP01000927.1.p1  ORF type:complete len:631 (-),score=133.81 GHVP01000927.1:249-2141(-)